MEYYAAITYNYKYYGDIHIHECDCCQAVSIRHRKVVCGVSIGVYACTRVYASVYDYKTTEKI